MGFVCGLCGHEPCAPGCKGYVEHALRAPLNISPEVIERAQQLEAERQAGDEREARRQEASWQEHDAREAAECTTPSPTSAPAQAARAMDTAVRIDMSALDAIEPLAYADREQLKAMADRIRNGDDQDVFAKEGPSSIFAAPRGCFGGLGRLTQETAHDVMQSMRTGPPLTPNRMLEEAMAHQRRMKALEVISVAILDANALMGVLRPGTGDAPQIERVTRELLILTDHARRIIDLPYLKVHGYSAGSKTHECAYTDCEDCPAALGLEVSVRCACWCHVKPERDVDEASIVAHAPHTNAGHLPLCQWRSVGLGDRSVVCVMSGLWGLTCKDCLIDIWGEGNPQRDPHHFFNHLPKPGPSEKARARQEKMRQEARPEDGIWVAPDPEVSMTAVTVDEAMAHSVSLPASIVAEVAAYEAEDAAKQVEPPVKLPKADF